MAPGKKIKSSVLAEAELLVEYDIPPQRFTLMGRVDKADSRHHPYRRTTKSTRPDGERTTLMEPLQPLCTSFGNAQSQSVMLFVASGAVTGKNGQKYVFA